MLKRLKYYLFFGLFAFLVVFASKIGDYLARDIQEKKNEITAVEKEIAALKQEIGSAVGITEIRNFAESQKWILTNPMDIITLETRGRNYAVKGQSYNILEQILTLWE
jgi:hypothetical protein